MRIEENPFYLLGATLRTETTEMMKLAERKSLSADDGAVDAALRQVLHPLYRIDAELSMVWWRTPRGLRRLVESWRSHPGQVLAAYLLPPSYVSSVRHLERVNILHYASPHVPRDDVSLQREIAVALGRSFARLQAEDIRVAINVYRARADVAAVPDAAPVAAAIARYRTEAAQNLAAAFDDGDADRLQTLLRTVFGESMNPYTLDVNEFVYALIEAYRWRYQDEIRNRLAQLDAQADDVCRCIWDEDWRRRIDDLFALAEAVFGITEVIQIAAQRRHRALPLWEQAGETLFRVADCIRQRRMMAYESRRVLERMQPLFMYSAKWTKRLEQSCRK